MGVSPGGDTGCVESVCTPGETIEERKTGVPQTRQFIVCIGLILYNCSLSANSQEALFTYVSVLLNYYCI